MVAWRSAIERKTPRFRRRLVSLAKKLSTAFSQEQEVGTKWKVKRGWRVSQARTLGCLCGAWLSRMTCTTLPAGTWRSVRFKGG